jgi:hypothetical protein
VLSSVAGILAVSPFLYRESHLDIGILIAKTPCRVKWKREMFLDNPVALSLQELPAGSGRPANLGNRPFFPNLLKLAKAGRNCNEKKRK